MDNTIEYAMKLANSILTNNLIIAIKYKFKFTYYCFFKEI